MFEACLVFTYIVIYRLSEWFSLPREKTSLIEVSNFSF